MRSLAAGAADLRNLDERIGVAPWWRPNAEVHARAVDEAVAPRIESEHADVDAVEDAGITVQPSGMVLQRTDHADAPVRRARLATRTMGVRLIDAHAQAQAPLVPDGDRIPSARLENDQRRRSRHRRGEVTGSDR